MDVWNPGWSDFKETKNSALVVVVVVVVVHVVIVVVFYFSKGAVGTKITIDTLCSIMNNEDIGDPLARYAKINSLLLQTHGFKCLDSSYKNMITSLQKTSWTSSASEGGKGENN